MRLWHWRLLPYMPEAQFKGQLRELIAVMRMLRDFNKTNHILINRVMEYPKADLYGYFMEYAVEYEKRYGKRPSCTDEFREFGEHEWTDCPFPGWHGKAYLRVCMANLYEKYMFGYGPSKAKITDEDWKRLTDGYKIITGEVYRL